MDPGIKESKLNDEGNEDRREVIERVDAGVLMSLRNSYDGRI